MLSFLTKSKWKFRTWNVSIQVVGGGGMAKENINAHYQRKAHGFITFRI